MSKTTRELGEEYAANFDDVDLVGVAKNGAYATFEEPDDYGAGGRRYRLSRRDLLAVEVVQTPYGPHVLYQGEE